MPIIKMSLTDTEYSELENQASKNNVGSIQDLIRLKLLSQNTSSIFVAEIAAQMANKKFTAESEPFSLPDIYGDKWSELEPRYTGAFGKRFFNYVRDNDCSIEFVGMSENQRRAIYKMK
ncbi:hypothetical protein [Clostridium sp. DL1XJH146]